MDNPRVTKIEWGWLEGQRPRSAGSNARLGEHGQTVRVPLARITLEDSLSGFGVCHKNRESAANLLGREWETLFSSAQGVAEAWRFFEYPLWDLAGCRAGQPVYALTAALTGMDKETLPQTPVRPPAPKSGGESLHESYRAPCYDTSLYFDDLHLASTEEAALLLAAEAREGYARGHRAFKIKVGRGARHLPLEEGTLRDIAIIRAVREAVGPACMLLLDANNGYNLNLTKRVLAETADCSIFWMEEAFHEDPVLYRDLREWLQKENLPVLIADGEGEASPSLLIWARDGFVNVIQYDIFGYGFTRWLFLGRQLDAWNVRSAPHHYGGHYGNYAACHLASAIRNFTFVEWDEVTTPGLNAPGYAIQDGFVQVPNTPGFGLELDETLFSRAVEQNGFMLSV